MPAVAQDLRSDHDVRHDGVGAHVGLELFVRRALARAEVLDEVLGLRGFAEVVIVGADSREERVGADGARGLLGEVRHGARVLVGARGVPSELLQERLLEVREIEQALARNVTEEPLGG